MKALFALLACLALTSAAQADVPAELCAGRPPTERARCRQVCTAVPASEDCLFTRRFGPNALDALKAQGNDPLVTAPEKARRAGLEAAAVSWLEDTRGVHACGAAQLEEVKGWLQALGDARAQQQCVDPQIALKALTAACGADHIVVIQLALRQAYTRLNKSASPEELRVMATRLAEGIGRVSMVLGNDHPSVLRMQYAQAKLLINAGDQEAGRLLMRKTLLRQEVVLGPSHADVRDSLTALSNLADAQKKHDLHLRLLADGLRRERHALGAQHPEVARTLLHMAKDEAKLGRLEKASPLAAEAETLFTLLAGAEHPETFSARLTRASIELRRRRYATARPLLESLIEAAQRSEGAQSETALVARYLLGLLLLETDQHDAAAKLLTEVLPPLEKAWGKDHRAIITIKKFLSTRPAPQAPARTVAGATGA